MAQISQEELARMQREAKARVAEMQKRSRSYTERIGQDQKMQKTRPDAADNVSQRHAENCEREPEAVTPVQAQKKTENVKNDDQAELFWLLFLMLLVAEEDRDLFLSLLIIMMD